MEQAELLDKCKVILGLESDYKLAKELDIPRMRISDYRLDKIKFDEYACFKIAEITRKSPTKVIARVLANNTKNERKRLFFQQFFMIAGLWITLGVMLPLLGSTFGSAYADGTTKINHINQHNSPLCEPSKLFTRFFSWLYALVFKVQKRNKFRILYV